MTRMRSLFSRRYGSLFLGLFLMGVLISFCSNTRAAEAPLRIAVAANFAEPARHIAQAFSARTGHKTQVSVASSGTLYAQITHGAPFDVFLSADAARPQKLVDEGLAAASTLFVYAQGRLIYINTGHPPNGQSDLSAALRKGQRLAIANPRLAPYGDAAKQVLQHMNMWEAVRPQLVMGKNILQTYQFYTSGNVPHAIVAASLVKDNDRSGWLIPASLHAPILQKVVVPGSSSQPATARKFVHFLMSDRIQQQLPQWGYTRYDATATDGDSHAK